MGLREEKKRATRAAIAAAALGRFKSVGFEATRVRDIAKELRISEATFFNYFPTKQAVLEAAAGDLIARSEARAECALTDDAPVPARLAGLVHAFAADVGDDREFLALVVAHARLFSESSEGQRRRQLAELLRQGQARAEIRPDVPADVLGAYYEAMMHVAVERWLRADSADDLAVGMRQALDVLLTGWADTG